MISYHIELGGFTLITDNIVRPDQNTVRVAIVILVIL